MAPTRPFVAARPETTYSFGFARSRTESRIFNSHLPTRSASSAPVGDFGKDRISHTQGDISPATSGPLMRPELCVGAEDECRSRISLLGQTGDGSCLLLVGKLVAAIGGVIAAGRVARLQNGSLVSL